MGKFVLESQSLTVNGALTVRPCLSGMTQIDVLALKDIMVSVNASLAVFYFLSLCSLGAEPRVGLTPPAVFLGQSGGLYESRCNVLVDGKQPS